MFLKRNERLNIYDLDKGALNSSILDGNNVIPMIIYSFDKKKKKKSLLNHKTELPSRRSSQSIVS